MNRQEWAKLTMKEQRIKVAELCGWKREPWDSMAPNLDRWTHPDYPSTNVSGTRALPDYLNDLNAMHEAEKLIPQELKQEWSSKLYWLLYTNPPKLWRVSQATAAERAEAFVLTMTGGEQ